MGKAKRKTSHFSPLPQPFLASFASMLNVPMVYCAIHSQSPRFPFSKHLTDASMRQLTGCKLQILEFRGLFQSRQS